MFTELNDNVSELKDSIGEVLIKITPAICCLVMLGMRRIFTVVSSRAADTSERLREVAYLRFKQRGTATCFVTTLLCALMLTAEV